MKNELIIIAYAVFFPSSMVAQNFSGRIVDNEHKPIEFANIVLLHKSDSSFIRGAVSDSIGFFSIPVYERKDDCYLKITSIGYNSVFIEHMIHMRDTIQLSPDVQQLGEVVVRGNRNIFKKESGKIVAKVEHSALANAGNTLDIFAQLPFLTESNGEYKVIGKGKPYIIVDSRPISDISELLRLKSKDIKSVEIITNPGVEYDASVSSVIRVHTTRNRQDNGFSGNQQAYLSMKKRLSEYANLNLKYRNNTVDFYFDGDFLQDRNDYKRVTTYEHVKTMQYQADVNTDKIVVNLSGGVSITPNKNHSLGMKYIWTRSPHANESGVSQILDDHSDLLSDGYSNSSLRHHKNYFNLYYTGKVREVDITFNTDCSFGNKSGLTTVHEDKQTADSVAYSIGDQHKLLASKLVFKSKISNHTSISVGGEYSYTDRQSSQAYNRTLDFLPNSNVEHEQLYYAMFADWTMKHKSFYVQLGMRYEVTDFKYYKDDSYVDTQSKRYHNLFPSFILGYDGEAVHCELFCKKNIERPTYDQLSNKATYITSFAQWSGNPLLFPSSTMEYGVDVSVYAFTFGAAIDRISKQIFEVVEPSLNGNNEAIVLLPRNLPTYNSYSVSLSYHTHIGVWNPIVSAATQFQNLTYGHPSSSYNKPLTEFSVQNVFKLKDDYTVSLSLAHRTKGHYATGYTNGYTGLNLMCSKSFYNKSLLLKFDFRDILNKSREKFMVKTNGVSVFDASIGGTRYVRASLVYYFNSKTNRYKGEQVSQNELKRL